MKKLSNLFVVVTCLFLISSCASTGQDSENTDDTSGIAPINDPTIMQDTSPEEEEDNVNSNADAGSGLFKSDFENEDNACWSKRDDNTQEWNLYGCNHFINIGRGHSVALAENEISHSGNKSLKITFNQNEDYGGADVRINDTNRVFTRYYNYYAADFDFAFGMKTHRIRSFDFKAENNNFDLVSHAWGRPTSGEHNFSGINDMSFSSLNYNGGKTANDWGSAEGSFTFSRNRWYCIETEVKLNDPGSANGQVRMWVDGDLVVERSRLDIRGNSNSKINLVLFGGWYSNAAFGNNSSPDPAASSVRYIDDVAIANSRIGCLP